VKLLALIALGYSLSTPAGAQSFAKRVDIGGGKDDVHRVSWQRITYRAAHLGYGRGV